MKAYCLLLIATFGSAVLGCSGTAAEATDGPSTDRESPCADAGRFITLDAGVQDAQSVSDASTPKTGYPPVYSNNNGFGSVYDSVGRSALGNGNSSSGTTAEGITADAGPTTLSEAIDRVSIFVCSLAFDKLESVLLNHPALQNSPSKFKVRLLVAHVQKYLGGSVTACTARVSDKLRYEVTLNGIDFDRPFDFPFADLDLCLGEIYDLPWESFLNRKYTPALTDFPACARLEDTVGDLEAYLNRF